VSDWRDELKALLESASGDEGPRPTGPTRVRGFISGVVVPAFEEIAEELQEHGRDVEVEFSDRNASIRIVHQGREEFYYEVKIRAYQKRKFAFPVTPLRDAEGRTYRAEIHLRDGAQHQDVTEVSKGELIRYFLHDYARHLRWHS
jgi:choline/glycine/proline betaine transport protein